MNLTTAGLRPRPAVLQRSARLLQRCGGNTCRRHDERDEMQEGGKHYPRFAVQASVLVGRQDSWLEAEADAAARSSAGGNPTGMPTITPHSVDSQADVVDGAAATAVAAATESQGNPLGERELGVYRQRFGHDFGKVRIHADGLAAQAAALVGAAAFAVGNHIVFGSGQYGHGSQASDYLMAHELAHVVQQGGTSATRLQRHDGGDAGISIPESQPALTPGQEPLPTPEAEPTPGPEPKEDPVAMTAWIDGTIPELKESIEESFSPKHETAAEKKLEATQVRKRSQFERDEGRRIKKLRDPAAAAAAQVAMEEKLAAMDADTALQVRAIHEKFATGRLPYRLAFMSTMRCFLGSDAATKSHFGRLRPANRSKVPGDVIMYEPAIEALEDVADELRGQGQGMPETTVAFDLRSRHIHPVTSGYMGHPLGHSIDFYAYDNPKIASKPLVALVSLVTGTSGHMELGSQGERRKTIEAMGQTCFDPEKVPRFKAFLDRVGSEFDRLQAASLKFRTDLPPANLAELQAIKQRYGEITAREAALTTEMKANALQLKAKPDDPDLLFKQKALQEEYNALLTELTQLPGKLAAVFDPWLKQVESIITEVTARAMAAGVDIDKVPTSKELEAANSLTNRMAEREKRIKAAGASSHPERSAGQLAKWQTELDTFRAQLAAQVAPALVPPPAISSPASEWHTAVATLRQWSNDRDQLNVWRQLQAGLQDPNFVFGPMKNVARPGATPVYDVQLSVENPSVSQLVQRGFFVRPEEAYPANTGSTEVRNEPNFNRLFFQTMAKHGFDPGAAWGQGSSDPMHFDYVNAFREIVGTNPKGCAEMALPAAP